MKVKIGISARHIHLTKEDFEYLFGKKEPTKYKDLSQLGEFSCVEVVNIVNGNKRIDNVRLVGPLRNYTQVEISKTDSYVLGINPPVRNSGDLENAEKLIIEHNGKVLEKDNCCIIATRHIHINTKDLEKYNFKDGDIVKIKVDGIKGGIIDNVYIKCSDNYVFEAHLDLDDANAHLIKNGDIGEIINE